MRSHMGSRGSIAALIASVVVVPGSALAATITTPFGPLDDSCVTQVPRGGAVDAQSGDVITSNGAHVGTAKKCFQPLPACTGGGWYDFSSANAQTIDGLQKFNYFAASWVVPYSPSPPAGDSPLEYFFPSLQAESVLGEFSTTTAIVQPVLSWGYGGASEWGVSAWGLFECNQTCTCTYVYQNGPYGPVNEGDYISSLTHQYEGNPDAWEIYIVDQTTGTWAETEVWNIPGSWPKFNTAQSAVNENYYVNSCQDLSPSNYIEFNDFSLYQAGPYWNDLNNVTGSTAWTFYNNPFGFSPACSWGSYGNKSESILYWSEEW